MLESGTMEELVGQGLAYRNHQDRSSARSRRLMYCRQLAVKGAIWQPAEPLPSLLLMITTDDLPVQDL